MCKSMIAVRGSFILSLGTSHPLKSRLWSDSKHGSHLRRGSRRRRRFTSYAKRMCSLRKAPRFPTSCVLSDPGPITALQEQFRDLGELADMCLLTGGTSRDDTREAVACAVQDGAYLLT